MRLMENELEVVQDRILAKSHERIILTDKISSSEQSYGVLKTDLDKFSEHMEELEAEVGSKQYLIWPQPIAVFVVRATGMVRPITLFVTENSCRTSK